MENEEVILKGMKRSRQILLIVIVVAVAALVAVVCWPREKEPEYEGKKLSEWVERLGARYNLIISFVYLPDAYIKESKECQAIRGIGTNAVPYLLNWISYDRPHWKQFLDKNAPQFVQRSSAFRSIVGRDLRYTRRGARVGLALIGRERPGMVDQALSAIIVVNPKAQSEAAGCLRDLGAQAEPTLKHLAEHSDPEVRRCAEETLAEIEQDRWLRKEVEEAEAKSAANVVRPGGSNAVIESFK